MAQRGKKAKQDIENYARTGKERVNNPPVGLVTPDTDRDAGKKTYAYDPHLDPQLTWAGKAEHTSFKVPTVSLHVHERIDPRTIVEAVRKRNGAKPQFSLFAAPEENPPIRQAIEFYKHKTGVKLAFLLFRVSFPFGFQIVSRQFSCGTSCSFGRGVQKHGVFSFQV